MLLLSFELISLVSTFIVVLFGDLAAAAAAAAAAWLFGVVGGASDKKSRSKCQGRI